MSDAPPAENGVAPQAVTEEMPGHKVISVLIPLLLLLNIHLARSLLATLLILPLTRASVPFLKPLLLICTSLSQVGTPLS